MTVTRTEVNVQTGETRVIELTAEEIAAAHAASAAEAEQRRMSMSVPPASAKIVLARAGHWDAVTSELAKPENLEARIYWDSASEFRRDNPYIAALGAAIGLTEAEIDALFKAATTL